MKIEEVYYKCPICGWIERAHDDYRDHLIECTQMVLGKLNAAQEDLIEEGLYAMVVDYPLINARRWTVVDRNGNEVKTQRRQEDDED